MSDGVPTDGPTATASFRALYLAINLFAVVALGVGAALGGSKDPRYLYLLLLVAACSSPLLQMRSLNDRYALLGVFLGIYFIFYGNVDLMALLGLGEDQTVSSDALTASELLVLLGAAAFIAGYHAASAAVRGLRPAGGGRRWRDWSERSLLLTGLALWAAGTVSVIILQVVLVPDKTAYTAAQGFARIGQGATSLVMLGNYLPTLGIAALAYGYARYRSRGWLMLILALIGVQVVVALAADIKSMALQAPALVILARIMRGGRIPYGWILAAAIGSGLVFPVLQAYRAVLSESGATRHEAVQQFGKTVGAAIQQSRAVMKGAREERAQTVLERSNLKPSIDIVIGHAGLDVPFQAGNTLRPLWLALVPRLIWPDKPDLAVGIMFNKEFHLGAGDETYISPSHLGELYWNFGWPGAALGMLLIGALFGVVGTRCDLSSGVSVTRVLLLLATAALIGIGFESSIATPYAVWIRTLLVIGLLHVLLARVAGPGRSPVPDPAAAGAADQPPRVGARYPNVLR